MPESENQLQIRCPKCSQRFKVGPELEGRVVECGRCENRFRVDDSVILKQKKFYPGEKRRDPSLDRFARTPVAPSVVQPVTFQTINYEPDASPESFEPPSIQRLLAGAFGGGMMLLAILAFITSGAGGGALEGVSAPRQLALAVFVAVLGSAFLIYANPRAKGKALLASLVLSGALVAMPLVFAPGEEAAPQPAAAGGVNRQPGGGEEPADETDPLALLREQMGYGPMEMEMAKASSADEVVGVWLRNMQERHRFQVRDYLMRVTGAGDASHLYPRTDTSFFFVLTGVPGKIEQIAQHCERIGRVERIIRPLQVVEVVIDNERFVEGPIERLSKRDDEGYYALNLRELECVDLSRATRAVERLTEAEPTQFRSDIVRRMSQLLDEAEPEQQAKIAKALQNWSELGDGAEAAVLKALLRHVQKHPEVPEEMVRFLVMRRNAEVLPVLHRAWLENPEDWESLYIEMGAAGESGLLEVVGKGDSRACRSAVRILERVGTAAAVASLQSARDGSNGEFRFLLERALHQVKTRAGLP